MDFPETLFSRHLRDISRCSQRVVLLPYDFSQHSCARVVVGGHTCVSRIRYFSECMDVECIANRPVSVVSVDRQSESIGDSLCFLRFSTRSTSNGLFEYRVPGYILFSSLILSSLPFILCSLIVSFPSVSLSLQRRSLPYLARLHAK